MNKPHTLTEIRAALTQARKDCKAAQLVLTRYVPATATGELTHVTTGQSVLDPQRTITVEW